MIPVATNPWDFTLYRADDGSHVIKVMFVEGNYKIDVGRYFLVDGPVDPGYPVDVLEVLAAKIRAEYPSTPMQELDGSDVGIAD